MGVPLPVHKVHGDGHIGLDLVVQLVNAPLPEKGQAGDGKGDGVGNAGLARPFPPVTTVGSPKVSSVGCS